MKLVSHPDHPDTDHALPSTTEMILQSSSTVPAGEFSIDKVVQVSSSPSVFLENKKILFGGALIVCLLVLAYYGFWYKPKAPDLNFSALSGERFSTVDLKGRVILVNFWATSCTTCIREMPDLVKLYQQFQGSKFDLLAVAMDYDPPVYVKNYVEQNRLPFKVILDVRGDIARGFGGVSMTPTTFLLDTEGHIIKTWLGIPDMLELQKLLTAQLTKPA